MALNIPLLLLGVPVPAVSGFPAWLPQAPSGDRPVLFADFAAGHYWLNGAEVSAADVLVEDVRNAGTLIVPTVGMVVTAGDYPPVLTAAAVAAIGSKGTGVAQHTITNNQAQHPVLLNGYDVLPPATQNSQLFITSSLSSAEIGSAFTFNDNGVYPSSLFFSFSVNDPIRMAATLDPNNLSNWGASVNGGVVGCTDAAAQVYGDPTVSVPPLGVVIVYGLTDAGGVAAATTEGVLSFVAWYAQPQLVASLPAMSAL